MKSSVNSAAIFKNNKIIFFKAIPKEIQLFNHINTYLNTLRLFRKI